MKAVERLVGAAYEKVESEVKAERRLQMLEKIVVDKLVEGSSGTGKISSSAAGK